MSEDKSALRREVWEALRVARAGRFPGILGRIPNFKGAEAAAEHLRALPEWAAARVVKINPDSPQRALRRAALAEGRTLLLPAPRLAADAPFLLLDPERIPEAALWHASSIKGAFELGVPTRLEDVPRVDLIVTGCVATDALGARLGKGGGYSDLEFGMLLQAGKLDPDVPILSTVHAAQVIEAGRIPVCAHDITLDAVATPEGVRRLRRPARRPAGVLPEALSAEKVAAIPALGRLLGR